MMEVYTKTIRVEEGDLDDLKHVNNVRYVQWIQDISKEHWQSVAPEEMRDRTVWVVRSHDIQYKNSAVLGDEVHIKTYIAETKGVLSIRIVEMYQKRTNALLLRSKTSWCLLDVASLRPMRITEDISSLFSPASNTQSS